MVRVRVEAGLLVWPSLLLWLLPLAPVFYGPGRMGDLAPLLAATLKYDTKRTKTDAFNAKISKIFYLTPNPSATRTSCFFLTTLIIRRHLSSDADCFSEPPSKSNLISFPDHFLPSCFRFLVAYTVYNSVLAVLYLSHCK